MISGLGGASQAGRLCSWLELCVFFSLPLSQVIPNPVNAAVHTMGNPIMTQLCVEIKTHTGCKELFVRAQREGTAVVRSLGKEWY